MISMEQQPARRSLLFSAAIFLVGAIGCIRIYFEATATGLLQVGSKSQKVLTLLESPDEFHFWLNTTIVVSAFFAAIGFASLWLAFRSTK